MAAGQVHLGVRVYPGELEAIDRARGIVPRATWVRAVLRRACELAAVEPEAGTVPELTAGDRRVVRVLGVEQLKQRLAAQEAAQGMEPIPGQVDVFEVLGEEQGG